MAPFQQQLKSCLPDLWRFGFSLTRDRNLADDLTQDCAERALRKQDLWAQEGDLKPWLMKMLLNIYRNDLRDQSRRPRLVAIDDMTSEIPVSDGIAQKLALSETAAAIQLLPDDQKEVLLLVVLGGLSYKQAALALDIPMGTLMSRLGRARARLRELTGEPSAAERQGSK